MRLIFGTFIILIIEMDNSQSVELIDFPTEKKLLKDRNCVWLIAAILFLSYGILYLLNARYAWLAGLLAMAVSQILVIMFWKDAKFGRLPNLIILIVALLSFGSFLLHSKFTSPVKVDFLENNTLCTDALTENDIAHLPIIVQKYLHYTKSVGQQKVKNFRAEFAGGNAYITKPIIKDE